MSIHRYFMYSTLGVLLLGTGPATAADAAKGAGIHAQSCAACHARLTDGKPDTLYTRTDRGVHNRNALWMQVQRCEQNLKLDLFDEDIDNVTEYLNTSYYHFKD